VVCLVVFFVLQRADPRWQPVWEQVEGRKLEESVLPKARTLEREAEKQYLEDARKPLNQHWKRRDEEEVKKAIAVLEEGRTKLQEAVEVLAKAGPYVSHDMENARNVRKEYLEEQVKLFELREKCLREGEAWTPAEQETLRDQTGLVEEAAQRWRALLKDGV
jgi:hypothetical protein